MRVMSTGQRLSRWGVSSITITPFQGLKVASWDFVSTEELLINMYGFWFIRFWTSAWNVFDTVVVSIGVLDPWLDELSPLTQHIPMIPHLSSLVRWAGGETSFRAEPMSALRSMMKYASFFWAVIQEERGKALGKPSYTCIFPVTFTMAFGLGRTMAVGGASDYVFVRLCMYGCVWHENHRWWAIFVHSPWFLWSGKFHYAMQRRNSRDKCKSMCVWIFRQSNLV